MLLKRDFIRITLFLLLFCIWLLWGQDLEDKKEKLETIKEEISKQELLIKEVESKQQKTEKDINQTLKDKNKTEKKIEQLKTNEIKAKSKLDQTISEIQTTTSELENLLILCEREFQNLCVSHYQAKIDTDKIIDSHFLADLIKNTASEIYSTRGQILELENNREKNSKEYEDYIWSSIVAKKQQDSYICKISELEDNLSNYSAEKKLALERKEELEREATALDELITRLQSNITSDDFSYQFSTTKLIWPVRGEIINNFGAQRIGEYKVYLQNDGIDISVEEGTPIKAVEDGEIAYAEWYNGAGKMVIINHKNGFYSLYSHNSALMVSKGDKVYKNQVIALSGKTGSTDVPCLHFELRKRQTPVNPLEYLE